MMRRTFLYGFCLLSLMGCENTLSLSQVLLQEDTRVKPKVAFLNIYDHSSSFLPWDLSLEFTQEIISKLKNLGSMQVLAQEDISWSQEPNFETIRPYRTSDFLKTSKPDAEFVVCIEIVDHLMIPTVQKQNMAHPDAQTNELHIKTRVKVYDIRKEEPKLILSEILTEKNTIPWQLSTIDYRKNHFKTNHFKITPVGLSHKRLIQTISKHLQDYVLLAKASE